MTDQYTYWREELETPGCNERDTDRRDLAGFWRLRGAVTKADYPLAIWPSKQLEGKLIARVGNVERAFEEDGKEWYDLLLGSWLNAFAVSHEDYKHAMENDKWPDGKISRHIEKPEEPKKEPEPAPDPQPVMNAPKPEPTPPGIGHNNPPENMGLIYKEKLKAENEVLNELLEVEMDDDVAEKVGECVNRIGVIEKDCKEEYEVHKKPVRDLGKKIDEAFNPTIKSCGVSKKRGKAASTEYLLKKQREAEAKAEEERKVRQAEEERRAKETAEIEGRDVKPEDVKQVKAKVENASIGAAAGRKVSLRTVTSAEITDADLFIQQVKDRADFKEFLQNLANAAARQDKELPGMKIKKEKVAA